MASKNLFKGAAAGKLAPPADTVNEAGGVAYAFGPKAALAQLAVTGCLNSTYYASDEKQLERILALAMGADSVFVAKTALYAREHGYMKDVQALLAAVLAKRDVEILKKVFSRLIDTPKMLMNFARIVRSGVTGRKSFGSAPKKLMQAWFSARGPTTIFTANIGQNPSLTDVIRMVRPKPQSSMDRALYSYLLGKKHDAEALPTLVQDFERFKADPENMNVPDVPFRLLDGISNLPETAWRLIAKNASWTTTRMNLNTFARHGVLKDANLVAIMADRLRSKPDVSGSMHDPITGHRKGSTSKVRCVDVAALISAALMRRNTTCEVIPFSDNLPITDAAHAARGRWRTEAPLNPRDSVMTNARRLMSLPAGGTNCSLPLQYLNAIHAAGDLLIYVSDKQSWMDSKTLSVGVAMAIPPWQRSGASARDCAS